MYSIFYQSHIAQPVYFLLCVLTAPVITQYTKGLIHHSISLPAMKHGVLISQQATLGY